MNSRETVELIIKQKGNCQFPITGLCRDCPAYRESEPCPFGDGRINKIEWMEGWLESKVEEKTRMTEAEARLFLKDSFLYGISDSAMERRIDILKKNGRIKQTPIEILMHNIQEVVERSGTFNMERHHFEIIEAALEGE